MDSQGSDVGMVVSSVRVDDEALVLVEDSLTTDSEGSVPESWRTWASGSAGDLRTVTFHAPSCSDDALCERLVEELTGSVMERSMADQVPREAMVASVRQARTAIPLRDDCALVVDGQPRRGFVATSGGSVVRGVLVGPTAVLAAAGDGSPRLALSASSEPA